MGRLLLNIDLGELPDEPIELYALAHLASVACGGHAGDTASMRRAVASAQAHGTLVAAHPSYPDREGFGRRSLALSPDALARSVAEQCAALAAVVREGAGEPIVRLKAHGALYHDVARDPALRAAFLDGSARGLGVTPAQLVVLGPPGLEVAPAQLLREGFADRGYGPDERLLPRGTPGALLDAAHAARQAARLVREARFETLCVHGDSPDAVVTARAVRAVLDAG